MQQSAGSTAESVTKGADGPLCELEKSGLQRKQNMKEAQRNKMVGRSIQAKQSNGQVSKGV